MSSTAVQSDGSETERRDPSESKPVIPDAYIRELVTRLYGMTVTEWTELNSYDDKNYHIHVEQQFENPHIDAISEKGYVLKILNSQDSKCPAIIEGQHKLLLHLNSKSLPVQLPISNVRGETWSLEAVPDPDNPERVNGPYAIHIITYIDGEILVKKPFYPSILYKVGKFAGKIHKAIQGYEDDYVKNKAKGFIWSLPELQGLTEYTIAVKDPENLDLVSKVIAEYVKDVIPKYSQMSEGYMHGDMNEQNILVNDNEDGSCDVTAFIDYMDAQYSYTVFDVAILIAYLSIESVDTDQVDVGGHVLAGYLTEQSLNSVEMEVIRVCMCGRLVQTLVLGAYSFYKNPTNTYVLQTSKRGWPLLKKIWNISNEELLRRWKSITDSYKRR